MGSNTKHAFETLAIHAGNRPDPTTGAIMPPIYQTSTYVQNGPGDHKGYEYSRTANPTRTALQENLAALENGKYGLSFSSGCAAASAVLHLLKSGDHIVSCGDIYGGTYRIFDGVFKQMGIDTTLIDMTDPKNLELAIRPNTQLIWIETPTNPLLKLVDLKACIEIAHNANTMVAVDNTFATPYLQNPLDFGADIVVHSVTKYIGGHSDVVGGAIVVNDEELHKKLAYIQNAIGAVPAPLDCFLVLRGTKTLHVRMDRHCQNARQIAKMLEEHNGVESVIYPGLRSHPQHELAARQMKDFGGMICFAVKGGLTAAQKVLKSVQLFACAESLGGVESLIEHPAIMTHASIPKKIREKNGITDSLIRVSVGIENVDDLITDLKAALDSI